MNFTEREIMHRLHDYRAELAELADRIRIEETSADSSEARLLPLWERVAEIAKLARLPRGRV